MNYVVTDNIIQYRGLTLPNDYITYLPSLNGWYIQTNISGQLTNIAYNSAAELSYDITGNYQILTGGGTNEVFLGGVQPTPTPTPTPSITPTNTPSVTPSNTA